jgi:hypothetical protein
MIEKKLKNGFKEVKGKYSQDSTWLEDDHFQVQKKVEKRDSNKIKNNNLFILT